MATKAIEQSTRLMEHIRGHIAGQMVRDMG